MSLYHLCQNVGALKLIRSLFCQYAASHIIYCTKVRFGYLLIELRLKDCFSSIMSELLSINNNLFKIISVFTHYPTFINLCQFLTVFCTSDAFKSTFFIVCNAWHSSWFLPVEYYSICYCYHISYKSWLQQEQR